jgi:mannose-6-phosphate isomerase class I
LQDVLLSYAFNSETLKKYDVKPGDVFFLPAGRVHAIGAGCFIAEIQQTSDITYRIYDYNRKDANGNTRELHTDLAKTLSTILYIRLTKQNTGPCPIILFNLLRANTLRRIFSTSVLKPIEITSFWIRSSFLFV